MQKVVGPVVGLPGFEDAEDSEFNNAMVLAYRGIGKSWLCAVLAVWLFLFDRNLNINVVSGNRKKSNEFTQFCLRLFDVIPIFEHLKPPKDVRQSMLGFDVCGAGVSQAPSMSSGSLMGANTGGRGDIIICDDIEIPNNSRTQEMRELVLSRTSEFSAILKPNGRVIYLGTPQCEDSLYNALLSRGYKRRIWPARYPSDRWMASNGAYLAPKLRKELEGDYTLSTGGGLSGQMGAPTDPQRFNESELKVREIDYASHEFALQFQLDTSLSDADRYPLKLSHLIVMDLDDNTGPEDPKWAPGKETVWKDGEGGVVCVGMSGDRFYRPLQLSDQQYVSYQQTIMFVDPSGRGKDEMAYAVIKAIDGVLFLMECRGLMGGYEDSSLTHLAERAKHWGVNKIITESNFGDGMFNKLLSGVLRKIYPCTLDEVRHSKQKEIRIIDTLEPVFNQHRLVVNAQVIRDDPRVDSSVPEDRKRLYQLMYQISRITREKGALAHDDRLDALAGAVAYLQNHLGKDAALEKKQRSEEARVKMIQDWERQELGVKKKTNLTWF